MSTNASNKATASGSRGTKAKQSKLITLQVPSKLLSRFPHEEKPASKASSTKSPASESSSTPAVPIKESSPAADVAPEANAEIKAEPTPESASGNGQGQTEGKKKGVGGPKPGQKRRLGTLNDGPVKPRAKPGPKRRKLEGDEAGRPWTTPQATGAGHKLGPKANQGAINAGLRALDRTGKPCRKWDKTVFCVKSFTGTMWALDSWNTGPRNGEENGNGAENATPNSNSENQQPSSNVGSEASHNQATTGIKPDVPSSPAPVPASA
ncbi:hypothetical protein MMC10_004066 [Thelotrema lepadinum]|nr:hypothetical protein [Thelotrema lepadinum]